MKRKQKVHIEITPHYAISAESEAWVIKYRPQAIDKETRDPIDGKYGKWETIKWFHDLNALIRYLKERLLRESNIASAIDLYEQAEKIDELFAKRHFEVISEVTIR